MSKASESKSEQTVLIPKSLLYMSTIFRRRKIHFLEIDEGRYCLLPKDDSNVDRPVGNLTGGRLTIPDEIWEKGAKWDFSIRKGVIHLIRI